MKLTARQTHFYEALVALYDVDNQSIHYTAVADALGVSPFTAYDMLRLLEEKGLVSSDYQLAADKSGPGRSEIVFMPTEHTRRLLNELGGGELAGGDWEAWREQLLARMGDPGIADSDVAEELLARISAEEEEPLRYCVEVISVIVLRLNQRRGNRRDQNRRRPISENKVQHTTSTS